MSALDVVGFGSMVVDRVHRAPRILRGEEKGILRDLGGGEPVRSYVGGVVLNHLGWAAVLGLRTGIFGRQADDENGRFLRAAMDRLGIARDIALDGSASSVAEIFVDDAGERAIYMAPGATAETTPEHVRRDHAAFLRTAARFTTEVSQLPLATARAALELAREAGIPTVVDLDVPPADAVPGLGSREDLDAVLGLADLLKPAKAAARALLPDVSDPLDLARAVRERWGSQAVVVTDGAAGAAIAAEGCEAFVPGRPVKVVDTTGAGDAFLGGLLTALHHGLGWEDAARLANACGAACVEKLGAFPDEPVAARERVLELYTGPALALGPVPAVSTEDAVAEALAFLGLASEELAAIAARSDASVFEPAVRLLAETAARGGRLHVMGIGKPEHVAHYAASLFASTGTPATFLHATEVAHGSAGQIVEGDAVIAVSNSGETLEMRSAVAAVRGMGAHVLAVTGGLDSWLARQADVVLPARVEREGGPLGLAPRASVVAEVVMLAGLSAALERYRGLTRAEYHRRHPGGKLGEISGT